MSGLDPEIQLPMTLTLDDHAGPATRISRERLTALVDTALLEYDRVTPSRAETQPTGSLAKPSPWAVAAGTALAIVAGAAAARFAFYDSSAATTKTTKPALAPSAPAGAVSSPTPAREEPIAPPARGMSPLGTPSSAGTAAGPMTLTPSEEPVKSRRTPVRGVNAPDDLLQKANQQRAAGRFRNAAQTYALVYERFPKSQAAYVARVAAASLELEHLSNPTRARKLFQQALTERPQGALDLEARQGLSVALRDLEDRTGERAVLRTLIDRHPGSPAARRAQVRLLELGGE